MAAVVTNGLQLLMRLCEVSDGVRQFRRTRRIPQNLARDWGFSLPNHVAT